MSSIKFANVIFRFVICSLHWVDLWSYGARIVVRKGRGKHTYDKEDTMERKVMTISVLTECRMSLAPRRRRTPKKHTFWSAYISYSHKHTTSTTLSTNGYSSSNCLRYHKILCIHSKRKLLNSRTNNYIHLPTV